MSSEQSDISKDNNRDPPSSTASSSSSGKGFSRSPLEYGSSLLGAGPPSYESRLAFKRTREIQKQEGVSSLFWSTSIGTSSPSKTPAEPAIPEDIPATEISPSFRRARAGTVPSRFQNPLVDDMSQLSLQPKHASSTLDLVSHASLVAPPPASVTPQRQHPTYHPPPQQTPSTASSRLRSGSLTLPRSLYQTSSTPFGPSIFASSYGSRGMGLSPASPAQSAFSRDDDAQTPVKTLDYLGLADTPTPPRGIRVTSSTPTVLENAPKTNGLATHHRELPMHHETEPLPGYLSAASRLREASRVRSYSVADKEKYDDEHAEFEYEDEEEQPQMLSHPSFLPPEVQTTPKSVYSNLFLDSHSPRPRASTTGVISSPPSLTADLFVPSSLHARMEAQKLNARGIQQYEAQPQLTLAHPVSRDDHQQGYYSYTTSTSEDITSQPSRALWLATVPQGVTQQHLETIFSQYGSIESSRVLTHKNCGFVNFVSIDDAMAARTALAGRELFPGAGGIKIGFAKVPSGIVLSPSPEPLLMASSMTNDSTHLIAQQRLEGSRSRSPALPPLKQIHPEILEILGEYGASEAELEASSASIARAEEYTSFRADIPGIPEPTPNRRYDAPRLRDIRKRIDNGSCAIEEIEAIALDMLPEIAELSSDYLGNTVVQKLFENCSEEVKMKMLIEIAPHLASIGVHKNGTWAAQKIIDVAKTEEQMELITESLHEYTPALFLDQFGNYVVQCCLRFGQPYTSFIFESMMEKLWETAQGRFGARAMRACLESHSATREQQRLMAAVITLNSVRLATNANGALLLTWLLDTCNFPKRFKTLAPRLLSHLAKLCTHKLASLTVLKLINQRSEPEAREIILTALFANPDDPENRILKRILEDQVHGAAVIYKILTSPFVVDAAYAEKRAQMVAVVRTMLQKLKIQPTQGYKRLMDEVGLSDRTIATPPLNGHRGGPQRSTTPRDYGAPPPQQPNAYTSAGAFYSPQYRGTPQQYMPPTTAQMDPMGTRPGQIDPTLLGGMDLSPGASSGAGTVFSSQQMGSTHQHPDPQAAAYQYQQMIMIQQSRPAYNGYSSTPPPQHPQPVPQAMYPTSQQSQFGGPLLPPPANMATGMYGVSGNQYPYSQGDVYAGNRQRPR